MAKFISWLSTLVAGAFLILLYLDRIGLPDASEIRNLRLYAFAVLALLGAVSLGLQWRARKTAPPVLPPSPARSGSNVVVATGIAAALYLGANAHAWVDFIAPAIVVALTIAVAGLVVHFASRYEGDIGEARFDTRNRE
ncbi:hypothetical protein [Sphingomonas sp.]|uniref:hypothetical protein n=1 Tax=Sphingomonas sp. TaxID=28214 RepID=UPI003D6C8E33